MESFAAILAAIGFAAVFAGVLWGIANGARRHAGVERCNSCAEKPVCDTGAFAGWLSIHPRRCPNLEPLEKR